MIVKNLFTLRSIFKKADVLYRTLPHHENELLGSKSSI